MLTKLGFRQFVYDWRSTDIATYEAEIEALKQQRIELLAWWFPFDASEPLARATLDLFRKHGMKPQLWVMQKVVGLPATREEWSKLLPPGIQGPTTAEEFEKLPEAHRIEVQKVLAKLMASDSPRTPEEQAERVRKEADRIYALARLAAPYGSKVQLYNHNGWFGEMGNQLAILARLREMGVSDVGIVYNFSHARDEAHDDTANFATIWQKIQPHVTAVNITGTSMDGKLIYPGQGDRELEMMRIIEASGWRGPIGLIAEKGGDAELTLTNYRRGLDWLAAELKRPGSGGPRPFPVIQ